MAAAGSREVRQEATAAVVIKARARNFDWKPLVAAAEAKTWNAGRVAASMTTAVVPKTTARFKVVYGGISSSSEGDNNLSSDSIRNCIWSSLTPSPSLSTLSLFLSLSLSLSLFLKLSIYLSI